MIPLAITSLAAIGALLYLLIRANQQIDSLLDRIQAPEVVVQRQVLESIEHEPDPVPVDMGPWSLPEKEEELDG